MFEEYDKEVEEAYFSLFRLTSPRRMNTFY